MKIESLSASAVKKFKRCPKSYYLRYLHEYEPPEAESKYLDIGNSVHDACEAVLEDIKSRDSEKLLEQLWKEDPEYYDSSERDTVESCFESASEYIHSYVPAGIQAIEERWTMDYRGIELVGYCDLVAGGKIIDWKTGKSEGKEQDEKIQASFYIELYRNEYGEYPESVEFVYLKEGTLSTHNRITDGGEVMWNEHENTYWSDTEKIINQILQSNNQGEWEAQPESSKCHFCDYKNYCEDSPIGAENVRRENIDVGVL